MGTAEYVPERESTEPSGNGADYLEPGHEGRVRDTLPADPVRSTRLRPAGLQRIPAAAPVLNRIGASLRSAWPVFVIFLAQRLLTVAFVYHYARSARNLFLRWDAGWYYRLAQGGYVYPHFSADGRLRASNLAYFPLYPLLSHWISRTGLVSLSQAMLLLSWFGGLLAVWAIFAFGNSLYGRSVGIALCAVFGMAPASLTFAMSYPEPLYIAAAAAAILALMRRRPVWAGALALVAGLLRPTAVVLIATIGIYFLVELGRWLVWRRSHPVGALERSDPGTEMTTTDLAPGRAFIGAVLSTLGVAAFMVYVGFRTGEVFGYFTVQNQWGLRSASSLGEYLKAVEHGLFHSPAASFIPVTLAVGLGYVLLYCFIVFDRRLVWASIYAGLLLVTSLAHVTFQHAMGRELIAGAFIYLIPVARMRVSRIGAITAITVGSILMAWGSAQFLITPGTGM